MGFFVLLGFIAYVVLVKFFVSKIGKYSGSKIAKYVAIAVFVLIPIWDIIPGQLFFSHVCKQQAGVKAFKIVEIDRSYFMPDGQPDQTKLAGQFEQPDQLDKEFSTLFHIWKFESSIREKNTHEVLGTAISFSHGGGWLFTTLLPQGSKDTCPEHHSAHTDIWREVIKPKQVDQRGGSDRADHN